MQHLWDGEQRPLKLIISGSLLSVMRERIFGSEAPLYGRRTAQIEFRPMSFADISGFYTEALSFRQRALMYAFCGGVPAYAERAALFSDYEEALLHLVLDRDAAFYQEPEFLVRQELKQPGTYFSILHALSAGRTKPNEIAQYAGIPHSSVNKYLETLRQMYLVRREVPITEHRPDKSTKGLHFLADHLLRFWFRYVYPHRSTVELGHSRELLANTIKPNLDDFMGPVYEEICHQEVSRSGKDLLGWMPLRQGRYWSGGDEIDIIAEAPEQERVAFIECKWSRNVQPDAVLRNLHKVADEIPRYHGWERCCYVMSRTQIHHPEHIQLGE